MTATATTITAPTVASKKPAPLTPLMLEVLGKIAAECAKEADSICYWTSTITLEKLESRGLVRTLPNRKGGPAVRVRVKPAGHAVLAAAAAKLAARAAKSKPAPTPVVTPEPAPAARTTTGPATAPKTTAVAPVAAEPHLAKSGSGRILARVRRGAGYRGCIALLDGALVKLHKPVDAAGDDEVWSHATLSTDERAGIASPLDTQERGIIAGHHDAQGRKLDRMLDVLDKPAPVQQPVTKPSPLRTHVADLVGGYANEADERADNEDCSDIERRAAKHVRRILDKLSADIRAGRVEI